MSKRQPRLDVIVVGGGVIGWSVAYHTAKAGLAVCVVDPHQRGGHASNVAAGLICPSPQLTKPTPFATIALASVQLFPNLRDELKERSDIDIQLDACGTLRIATSEEQAKHQKKRLSAQQHLGINLCWLAAEEVQQLEPALTVPLFGAVYGPDESQITATRLIQAYRGAATRLGATFAETICQRLISKGHKIIGIATKTGEIHAPHVIIAGGVGSLPLVESLGVHFPIEPERGQIAVVSPMIPRLRHIIFGEQIYLAPKRNDRIIIGGIKDRGTVSENPSVVGVSELLRKGMLIAAPIASADVKRTLAGIRPRTPDGLPIIGPVPDWEGLSIAAGHNSNGLLLSPMTGQIITAQLTGQPTPIEATPYLPARFSQRDPLPQREPATA